MNSVQISVNINTEPPLSLDIILVDSEHPDKQSEKIMQDESALWENFIAVPQDATL